MSLEEVLVYLTPFFVMLGTWIFNKVSPLVPGWLVVTFVTILTALITYIYQLLATPDLAWYWQFALGMLAITLNQVVKQFSPEKRAEDKAKIEKVKASKQ